MRGAHLVLGAGCAGLSLVCALLDAGVREPIVVVDTRTRFDHDRTWCFWATSADLPFADLATHAWPSWQLVARDGRRLVHDAPRQPYLHLPADRFYAAALARIARAPNVELRLGERVLAVRASATRVCVDTSRTTLDGAYAYDAMGGGGPLLRGRAPGTVELRQRFLGLEVEVERPVFDPTLATLMDFRHTRPRAGALGFTYLLPFSATRALVEDTSIGGPTVSAADRREALAAHLREVWDAGAVTPVREERGALLMTSHPFRAARSPRLLAVGAAAGALRPSSGYAFVRLQRHVQAVAAAVTCGTPAPRRIGRPRHRVLDRLFLRALAADPARFDRHLLDLADGVPASTFARFMTDASSPREELAVAAAMTRPGFLAAMARGAPRARPGAPAPALVPA